MSPASTCPKSNYIPLARPRLPYEILLALGGWGNYGPSNGSEAYDPRADCWVDMTFYEESPRLFHGVVFLNGFIYCICGWDNEVRKFNPVTRTWHQVTRSYLSVAVLNGCIYAMGGLEGEHQDNAERYDPVNNQWTVIAPMHEARTDASATALHGKVVDDRLVVIGGIDVFTVVTSAVEYYDARSREWSKAPDMRYGRTNLGCCVQGLPNMDRYTVPRNSRKRKMDLLEDRPNKVFRPDLPEAGSSTAQIHG